jgi:hypothetical protein
MKPPAPDAAKIFPEGFARYAVKRVQQDDLSVRRKLQTELEKVRAHVQSVHEEGHRASMTKVTDAARRVLDEIDSFQNEMRLAEGGSTLPFFSPNRSATPETIAKVVDFDYAGLAALAQAKDAARLLDEQAATAPPEASAVGLSQLRAHVTAARSAFKDRRDFLRGIR